MDRGQGFPGGSGPPGGNRRGSGLPNNMFSPDLGGIDPQYAAAIDFEELRIRHQLEVQQDMQLRHRLMEEQQHQLLSELEYRNKIQQLQELQELQAQQQVQQQEAQRQEAQRQEARRRQQQGLSQLLAQNPKLLELHHQQQQYNQGSLLSSLQDDFLLQRQQQMLKDQMQQRLQEQMSRDSARQQQNEQEEFLALLQARAAGNNFPRGVGMLAPTEVTSLRSPLPQEPPVPQAGKLGRLPAPSTPVQQMEQTLNHNMNINNNMPREGSLQTGRQREASAQPMVPKERKKRAHSETSNKRDGKKGTPQDQRVMPAKKRKSQAKAKEPFPFQAKQPPVVANGRGIPKPHIVKMAPFKDKALDEKVNRILEAQKLPASAVARLTKSSTSKSKKTKKKVQVKGQAVPVVTGRTDTVRADTGCTDTAEETPKKKKNKFTAPVPTLVHEVKKKVPFSEVDLEEAEDTVIKFLRSRSNLKGNRSNLSNAVEEERKKNVEENQNDNKAAQIVLKFKKFDVSESEVKKAKKWSTLKKPPRATTYPVVKPEDVPFISPGLKFNIPPLPIEPELTDFELANIGPLITQQHSLVDFTKPNGSSSEHARSKLLIPSHHKKIFTTRHSGKKEDEWYPGNALIRRERRIIGTNANEEDTDDELELSSDNIVEKHIDGKVSFAKAGLEAMQERFETSVEPGVIEKLPHCQLYNAFCKGKSGDHAPKFCCQTTETFPFEVMVCCSICSTWRHAQCGGHYKHHTEATVDQSEEPFQPICDACFFEKQVVEETNHRGVVAKRLERQRVDYLRRTNATNAVMRQVAFNKHSGQYKWPLGSVSISHISGHTRSVQARHEKAEKQWSEMATRLNVQELRPRERQRVRTREFERLMLSVEEAESAMDRQNMMRFLQTDTAKEHPAGFEIPRRNIFDPEDDPVYVMPALKNAKKSEENENAENNGRDSKKKENGSSTLDTSKKAGDNVPALKTEKVVASVSANDNNGGANILGVAVDKKDDASEAAANTCHAVCCGKGCKGKPRFDSIFCSDSCGVSTLQTDLLRTLQYASRLHPSMLRS